MEDKTIICTSCGSDVPEGKFCKDCGSEMLPSVEIGIGSIHEPIETTVDSQDERLPNFDFSVEDMDFFSQAILFSRAELELLSKELDELIDRIRATRQALQLKQADTGILAERAETLKFQLGSAKKRRTELSRVKKRLKIEEIYETLLEFKSKREKLIELKGTIDSKVFNEQRSAIEENIDRIQRDLKAEIKISKNWHKSISKLIKELSREIDRLEARLKIGDISRSEYETRHRALKRSLNILHGGERILSEILVLVEE